MKSQVLQTVWCTIIGEAAGEIWHWSLLEAPGASHHASDFFLLHRTDKISLFLTDHKMLHERLPQISASHWFCMVEYRICIPQSQLEARSKRPEEKSGNTWGLPIPILGKLLFSMLGHILSYWLPYCCHLTGDDCIYTLLPALPADTAVSHWEWLNY